MAQLHRVDMEGFQLEVQTVVDELPGENQDYLYDMIEEIMEDGVKEAGAFIPFGQWMMLPVEAVDVDHVKLGNVVFKDAYLAERLQGVHDAIIYHIHVTEAMWKYYWTFDDPLDSYLFNRVMSSCLNQGFMRLIGEIASSLPDYCEGRMDNPGISARWDISGQWNLVKCFEEESNHEAYPIPLKENGLFENQYSYMGLIYGKVPEGSNGKWREKLSIAALSNEIRDSAGF